MVENSIYFIAGIILGCCLGYSAATLLNIVKMNNFITEYHKSCWESLFKDEKED